jgi:carbon-monoxide dehydrogenase medium subunit
MPQPFEYYRPKTRTEAITLLARPNFQAVPLIVPPKPSALRQMGVDVFIDLSLLELDYIRKTEDGFIHIGALATLQEMVESPILKEATHLLLSQAAKLSAVPGIRNLAGLWGAIQVNDGPQEIPLALLALEAHIVLLGTDEKQRSISFLEFRKPGRNTLQKGELVLEACLPAARIGSGWALERVARTPRDEAIVAAAALVETVNGKASRVVLALAGADPLPGRSTQVEEKLVGQDFNARNLQQAAEIIQQQANPVGDFRGSPDYRRAMAGLVARRALEKAWNQATHQEKGA